jgi:hypothetical protein
MDRPVVAPTSLCYRHYTRASTGRHHHRVLQCTIDSRDPSWNAEKLSEDQSPAESHKSALTERGSLNVSCPPRVTADDQLPIVVITDRDHCTRFLEQSWGRRRSPQAHLTSAVQLGWAQRRARIEITGHRPRATAPGRGCVKTKIARRVGSTAFDSNKQSRLKSNVHG